MKNMNMETEKDSSENEISLMDLLAVLWQRRKMIIAITLTAAVGVVVFSVISLALPSKISPLPNQYTPAALMLIENRSAGGNLSSMLGNMSSLAALAGIAMPSSSNLSQLAIFLTTTNSLLDSIVDDFDLIERYNINTDRSPRAESREILKKLIETEFNSGSGVLSVSFTDTDPEIARDVVNYIVNYLSMRFDELGLDKNKIEKENLEINLENTYEEILNLEEQVRLIEQSVAAASRTGSLPAISIEINRLSIELSAMRQVYTQLRVQYELLKVSMASEQPVFQILEMAEVPDRKSKPSRGLLCVIVTFAAFFFSVFLAFSLNAISNIKKDPAALAKLRGENETQ